MSLRLRAFLVVVCLAFLAYVVVMVRRDRFLLKYSIVWLALALLGALAAAFPDIVLCASSLLGFETAANFVLFACVAFLIVSSMVFVSALTRQSETIRTLVQELSILKAGLGRREKPMGRWEAPQRQGDNRETWVARDGEAGAVDDGENTAAIDEPRGGGI